METNFYIGQEVVAIKNHSQGIFKKGDEFIIQGIKKEPCCGLLSVDIGINANYSIVTCVCGHETINDNYFSSKCFAPKQELSETTYNEVMEWIKKGNQITILN